MSKTLYHHWSQKQGLLEINYMNSFSNYQKYIFKYFQEKGYQIDVYFSTNMMTDEEQKELIKTYKPVSYSFNKN